MFSQILFPVDFTGSSERVVPFVRSMAEKYDSYIHIIHVVAEIGAELYVPGETIVSFIAEIRESAEKMLAEYVEGHFSTHRKVSGLILEGDPAEQIIKFAKRQKDGVIIMATHGRKGLDRVVFGSVAENVVRTSPLPVLTINPHLVADSETAARP